MNRVKLGIIGFGMQGQFYANLLTGQSPFPGMPSSGIEPEAIELGGLCDIAPAAKAKCAEQFPDTPFFQEWQEMVTSGKVDAVVITLPHYMHPEIAIFALDQGLHTLVEKPAGVYTKQVREMNEFAATKPDLTFAMMFNQRTSSLYQRLKEIISSGELGNIRRSNWIINSWWRPQGYYDQSDWRATWGGEGGGVLVNQAPHQLDLWQWLCGMPKTISAKIIYGAHRDIGVDNDVTAVADYGNGVTGVFVTCTHDPIGTDRLEINLDGGKIVVEKSKVATVSRLKKSEAVMNATMTMMEVGKMMMSGKQDELYTTETIEDTDGWGTQHLEVLENFARNILNGTTLIAPGADGINGVALANAMLLSSWLGKEVNLPIDEDLYLGELNKRIAAEGKFPTQ
ncbi:Gfo/Idh/MocA family oxidoreductase [Chloroflexi bacterium TSY]|nr:Gfo/Idh/MocA family oxidoreductase [Chloroflexi bacterium TSY]